MGRAIEAQGWRAEEEEEREEGLKRRDYEEVGIGMTCPDQLKVPNLRRRRQLAFSSLCLSLDGVLVTISSLTRNISHRLSPCFHFLTEVPLELCYPVSEGC